MYCLSGGCWIGSRGITSEFYLGQSLEVSWKSGCSWRREVAIEVLCEGGGSLLVG